MNPRTKEQIAADIYAAYDRFNALMQEADAAGITVSFHGSSDSSFATQRNRTLISLSVYETPSPLKHFPRPTASP